MDRAWRWCIERTLRDLELSVRRGRPITRPNLERLFCRRWWRAAPGDPGAELDRRAARGQLCIRRRYRPEAKPRQQLGRVHGQK